MTGPTREEVVQWAVDAGLGYLSTGGNYSSAFVHGPVQSERFAALAFAAGARSAAEDARDAARYRWLRGDSCKDHSRRWTQWEVRCWNAPHWTADLRRVELDAAIDAAMSGEKDA